jgi:hypothetical protein
MGESNVYNWGVGKHIRLTSYVSYQKPSTSHSSLKHNYSILGAQYKTSFTTASSSSSLMALKSSITCFIYFNGK